jgi:integrase
MASIDVILRLEKAGRDGRAPIYLRIQARGQRRLVSLGEKVDPAAWDAVRGRVRSRHPDADLINVLIAERLSRVQDALYEARRGGQRASADRLKEAALTSGPDLSRDFLAFGQAFALEMEAKGQVYTAKRYRNVLAQLERFSGTPLPFDHLTTRMLREYETYRYGERHNRPATVASHFRAIRAMLYRARAEGVHTGPNPFDAFSVGNPRGERTRLTPGMIRQFEEADLEDGSWPWHARNCFLFSFYAAGIRFRDLVFLRWRNVVPDGEVLRLEYRMSKSGRQKAAKLVPQALRILEHYGDLSLAGRDAFIFPFLVGADLSSETSTMRAVQSKNASVNRELKIAARLAGLQVPFSYYTSKHSYADFALRSGADVYTISKALGHSGLKATEHYLKGFDHAGLDQHMDELFGSE